MRLVQNVTDLSKEIVENSKYVKINHRVMNDVFNDITINYPKPSEELSCDGLIQELVCCSIDFCFWYGSTNIRPQGSCSANMRCIVRDIFSRHNEISEQILKTIILDQVVPKLVLNHFPLIKERVDILDGLVNNLRTVSDFIREIYYNGNFEKTFDMLVNKIYSFKDDLFLKRAFLFMLQLYRKFGLFDKEIKNHMILVPADYKIPMVLEYYGILEYNADLKRKILNNELIHKNSLMEAEIRAATIEACLDLTISKRINISDLDSFLWIRSHQIKNNFHLTVTTDY